MADFDELEFAMRMRDVIRKIVSEEIEAIRPKCTYGTVVSIDSVNHQCDVTLLGDTSVITVKMGSIQPTDVASIVRVEGLPGDRYIQDVMTGGVFIG